MKNLRLVIGIVVILVIVCSPVLAISMSDLIAQRQGQYIPPIPIVFPEDPLNSMSFVDIPCNCFDCNLFERHRAPDFTEVHNIAVPIPTTIPTRPMPTPSPSTLDIYVEDPYPATLFPSYYEYSKFPAPKPCIYGPPPGMSDEEWEKMMAEAREQLHGGVL
jgi:hypothetical protein